MITGIYKLTFTSGMIYIGKSNDIKSRLKQHADKFKKGTAALRMQREYDKYGMPEGEVFYECHEDHCDILESMFIHSFTRGALLNTVSPNKYSDTAVDIVSGNTTLFKQSTLAHVNKINELNNIVNQLADIRIRLEKELTILKTDGVVLPRVAREKEVKLIQDLANVENHRDRLQEALNRETSKSWWKRIFR